jgi:amino acid adenylation domain-containing protein
VAEPVTRLPRWSADQGREPQAPVTADLPVGTGEPELLAAFIRVLALLTGEDDLLIGCRAEAGAPLAALRVTLPGGSWRDLIAAAGQAAQTARAASQAAWPSSAGPAGMAFDVGFGPGLAPGPELSTGSAPGAGLALALSRTGPRAAVCCRGGEFDAAYAARFAGYLRTALAAVAARPAAPYSETDLMSPGERDLLLRRGTGPRRPLPPGFVPALVEQQARATPEAIAAVYQGEWWTYDRVNRAANQIAHGLLAAGLRPEDVVGVATQRHLGWLAAVLGVLKAGGAYLPVEPELPAARVADLVTRSRCRFLLTEPGAPPPAGRTLWTRPVADLLRANHDDANPGLVIHPGQLAYIYFTSGSTGMPKGAMCEHLGLLNHVCAKVDDLAIGSSDVVVQSARQSFDISLWQLIAPLTVGGRTLIVPAETIMDTARFAGAIAAGGATILQVVPSYLDILLRHWEQYPGRPGALRYVSVTGEAIPRALAQRWFARCPGIPLVNAYGATEACDDATHEVLPALPPGDLVPVGRPLGNVTVYVLGPDATLRPLGAPGEIAFAGICVGRGYAGDPGRTAEVFTPDPFRPGARMYRTGDFGRWLPGGSLEYHGRRDEQVKVHGVRIELGEVQGRVLDCPLVQAAAVIAVPQAGSGQELVAFYVSADGLGPERLREHLAGTLPAAAVPARLHRLEALPLTANGKVDKRGLAALASQPPPGAGSRGSRPGTSTERAIAAAWAQALDVPEDAIGREDDFFGLGGSSLSALHVVTSLHGLVSLNDLLDHPVLSALAQAVDGGGGPTGGIRG